MALSLADRILSYRDMGDGRGTTRKTPEAGGSRDAAAPLGDAGCMPDASPAPRMRGLFGDVARDWSDVVEVVDLEKAVAGSAIEPTIGAAGVRAAVEYERSGSGLRGGEVEALPRAAEEMP